MSRLTSWHNITRSDRWFSSFTKTTRARTSVPKRHWYQSVLACFISVRLTHIALIIEMFVLLNIHLHSFSFHRVLY